MAQNVKIERQIAEAQIKLFRAKRDLQNALRATYEARSIAERALVARFLEASGLMVSPTPFQGSRDTASFWVCRAEQVTAAFNDWAEKHKAETKAQTDIYMIQAGELESQAQIREKTLENHDRLVRDPREGLGR